MTTFKRNKKVRLSFPRKDIQKRNFCGEMYAKSTVNSLPVIIDEPPEHTFQDFTHQLENNFEMEMKTE